MISDLVTFVIDMWLCFESTSRENFLTVEDVYVDCRQCVIDMADGGGYLT